MNVWTAVTDYGTGNEIPSAPNARHDWLPLRRLEGHLAGWLDPAPPLVSGDGRASPYGANRR